MKKEYEKPKSIDLSETTDVNDILEATSKFSDATAEEISDIFSIGINPNIKKRFDYADLVTISLDIDRYGEYLYNNPNKYISEKQLYTERMHLSKEKSDKFRPNASEPRLFPATIIQAYINDFIFKTENIIKRTTCINDIKKIDGIYDSITLIKPKLRDRNGKYMNNHDNIDNYGFSNVITEIRNGLMHNSYIIYGNNVYINNPEGGNDENGFEAVVSSDFFIYMYHFGRKESRKPETIGLDESNIKWEKGYQANENNLRMIISDTKKSNELMDIPGQSNYLREKGIDKTHPLSAGKKELLKGFFEEYEFCEESLNYAIIGMEDKCLGVDLWHQTIPGQKNEYLLGLRNKYVMLNSSTPGRQRLWNILTEGNDINNRLIRNDSKYLSEYFKNCIKPDGSNPTKKELLKIEHYVYYIKTVLESYRFMIFETDFKLDNLKILYISKFFINNPTLKLAEPQKREGVALKNQCINFIKNKCKNKPEIYRSRESKQSNLNKILGHNYWLHIFRQYTSGLLSTDQIIEKTFEDKRITGDKREILKNNIINVIEKRENQLNEVTIIQEPEHIRNAFAHHNYTIIPGYNKILLEDPSRDDFPNWRKIYDLDELYQSCQDKTNEYFLGKE